MLKHWRDFWPRQWRFHSWEWQFLNITALQHRGVTNCHPNNLFLYNCTLNCHYYRTRWSWYFLILSTVKLQEILLRNIIGKINIIFQVLCRRMEQPARQKFQKQTCCLRCYGSMEQLRNTELLLYKPSISWLNKTGLLQKLKPRTNMNP